MTRINAGSRARIWAPYSTRRTLLLALGAVGLSAALPSHASLKQSQHTAAYPKLAIVARDYRFELPSRISSGYTEVTLKNEGAASHHAMLMRLNAGQTFDSFQQTAQHGEMGALFGIASSVGGPGTVDPGEESRVIVNLTPGQYAAICIVPDANGMPHYKMGMLSPLVVTAASKEGSMPSAELTVDLVDFSFAGMPAEIRSGEHLWKVIDTGQELHEMILNRIKPGVSFKQIEAMLKASFADPSQPPSGAPPFVSMAGVAPMSPQGINWAVLDLTPGDYFAICFVPDPKSGKPHFELGMIMPFTVRS